MGTKPYKCKNLNWEQISTDDWMGKSGNVTVRAKRMDQDRWWGCFYIGDEQKWYGDAKTERGIKTIITTALNQYYEAPKPEEHQNLTKAEFDTFCFRSGMVVNCNGEERKILSVNFKQRSYWICTGRQYLWISAIAYPPPYMFLETESMEDHVFNIDKVDKSEV